MRIKLEKRAQPSNFMLVATPVASVLITMLIGVVVFDLIGINGYYSLLSMVMNASRTTVPASTQAPLPTL